MKRVPLLKRKQRVSILDAIDDPHLFGPHFTQTKDWQAWRTFLAALFGLSLDDKQLSLFQDCTGREYLREGGTDEAWLVVGRRGGKSFILATIAVFLACFRDWRSYLGPGERGTVM